MLYTIWKACNVRRKEGGKLLIFSSDSAVRGSERLKRKLNGGSERVGENLTAYVCVKLESDVSLGEEKSVAESVYICCHESNGCCASWQHSAAACGYGMHCLPAHLILPSQRCWRQRCCYRWQAFSATASEAFSVCVECLPM